MSQALAVFKRINLKGDAIASVATFFAQSVVKFGSSLILTRVLQPDAYGVVSILMSVTFTLAMLSDLGTHVGVTRSPEGDSPPYLNTAWTMRLVRCLINAGLIYLLAPLCAAFYGMPVLKEPLKWLALWFLVDGFESNAYLLAARRKNTRIVVYSDLVANVIGTVASIAYSLVSRDFWGMVFGIMVTRVVYVLLSYAFYRDMLPRLQFDKAVARDIFQFTRVVMPSSILTLMLDQFDKVIFLKFFDLRMLGLYGLAGNLAGQAEALAIKVSQMVIYPRCAHDFRLERDRFAIRFYTENVRVFAVMGALVGALGGAANLLIFLLYDLRYSVAAGILQIITVRSVLVLFSAPAENLLVAAGELGVLVVGNVLRVIFIVVGAWVGFHIAGFDGFIGGMALSGLPTVMYYFWRQHRIQALALRYELYKLLYVGGVALGVFLFCNWFQGMFHVSRLHFHL